ncbi:M14 family metallopeptidase [candidate division KSB1 bacterium]
MSTKFICNTRALRIASVLRGSLLLALFFIAVIPAGPVPAQDFSKYHTYDELSSTLRNMVNAHRDISKIESIGKTLEGRDIWMVEIANPDGIPVNERPGMLITANFEGDHLIGSEISLYVVNYLLTRYSTSSDIRESIDNHVFYVVPRVNPDAAEFMFADVKAGRRTNTKPYDGDNDGRIDEDGPEDLNGDGYITVMRVQDPFGKYMIHPDDPRLMKEAEPAKGETGSFTVYWEGIDNDNDSYINEDPPGGIDINRNFQHEYPYYQPDAGWHMVSELESRAVMDFTIGHRNVAVMLTFGESDNLIAAPNNRGELSSSRGIDLFAFADASLDGVESVGMFQLGGGGSRGGFRGQQQQQQQQPSRPSGRQPATTIDSADRDYFTMISEQYGEATALDLQPMVRNPEGAFFQYGYYQFGVFSFSTPGWGISGEMERGQRQGAQSRQAAPGAAAARAAGIDKTFLDWMGREAVDGFVNWTPFAHPELGSVEIGGFTPYEVTNPSASRISQLGESHAEFVQYLSTLYAEVKIANTEVTNHGGGLFRIKAEIVNSGILPTSSQHGVVSRSVKPTMVQLGVDPKQIIAGNNKTSFFQKLDGSGKRLKFEWLIRGESGDRVELVVAAQKAGSDRTTITLR